SLERGACPPPVQGRCQHENAGKSPGFRAVRPPRATTCPVGRTGAAACSQVPTGDGSCGQERGAYTESLLMIQSTVTGGRILVVEDDPDIAHLLARTLERAGFSVSTRHAGTEAL